MQIQIASKNLLLQIFAVCFLFYCPNIQAKTTISKVENRKWVKVSTSNFTLITDLKEKKAIRIASDLETFRRMYQLVFATDLATQETPVKIIAPKKSEIYGMFIGGNRQLQESNGFFVANNYGNYATVKANRFSESRRAHRTTNPSVIDGRKLTVDQSSLNLLFHEYTHYLVANQNKHNLPFWYSEGFAEYLSSARVQSSGLAIFGEAIEYHLNSINRGAWVNIERILKTPRNAVAGMQGKSQVYAQGWLMVHYFLSDAERAEQLHEFLSLLSSGLSVDEALVKALDRDYEQLDQELRRYAKRGKLYYKKINTKTKNEKPIILSDVLTPAEALFEFGEFFLNGLTQPSQAEGFFTRSVEIDPGNGEALAGLAKVYVNTNQQLAQKLIRQALEYKPFSPWVHVVAGDINVAILSTSGPDSSKEVFRDQAMLYYDRALQLNPHTVAALSSKASLYLKQANFERALELFQEAYKYAPTSSQARFDLIVSHYSVGEFEEGDIIAEIVRRHHHASIEEIDSFNSWAAEQKANAKAYFEQQVQ